MWARHRALLARELTLAPSSRRRGAVALGKRNWHACCGAAASSRWTTSWLGTSALYCNVHQWRRGQGVVRQRGYRNERERGCASSESLRQVTARPLHHQTDDLLGHLQRPRLGAELVSPTPGRRVRFAIWLALAAGGRPASPAGALDRKACRRGRRRRYLSSASRRTSEHSREVARAKRRPVMRAIAEISRPPSTDPVLQTVRNPNDELHTSVDNGCGTLAG